jgi:hypothetical protein
MDARAPSGPLQPFISSPSSVATRKDVVDPEKLEEAEISTFPPPSGPVSDIASNPLRQYRRTSLHIDIETETDTFPLLPVATSTAIPIEADLEADPSDPYHDPMARRKQVKSPDPDDSPPPPLSPSSNGNGHSNGHSNGHATGAMSGSLLEHRRKARTSLDSSVQSPAEAHAMHLLSRSSFTLDDPVPALHENGSGTGGGNSRGFSDLPEKDRRNFLLLVLLYFLQGLPMGLAMGSVSILLKKHVSYSQMGVFSLASYPYSLKLLWSPIVDAVWSPKLGRRKSWILPIQTLSGISMLWLAGHVESMLDHAGDNGGNNVWGFTWWWFALVFMCATQDIAVDGTYWIVSHEKPDR